MSNMQKDIANNFLSSGSVEQGENLTQEKLPTGELLYAIHELTKLLARGLNLDEILQKVVESCKNISNATVSSIFLANEEKTKLTMYAQTGYQEDLRGEAEYDLPTESSVIKNVLEEIDKVIESKSTVPDGSPLRIGLTAWIFLSKQTVSVKSNEELRRHPAWRGKYDGRQYKESPECSSLVGVPLVVENEPIGVLKVEQKISDERHPEKFFTEEEVHTFEFFASIVALVVRTARLMEQRKWLANLLTNLYQLGALLHEQENYNRLLHIFLTGLTHGEVLRMNRVIFLEFIPVTRQLIGMMAIGPINKKEGQEIKKDMETNRPTIEGCISKFDEYGGPIPGKLQDKVANMRLDLERDCMCFSLIEEMVKSIHILSDDDRLSPQLSEFLKSIEVEKVLMIVSPIVKEKVFVVLCDNIYDKKGFDDLTINLLNTFVDLTSRALQRFYQREEVRSAKEMAWQEAAGSAAHKLGQILPIVENRLREIVDRPTMISEDKNFLPETLKYVTAAEEVLRDFGRFTGVVRLDKLALFRVEDMFEKIKRFLKETHRDVHFQFNMDNEAQELKVKVDIDVLNQQVIEALVKNSIEAKYEGLKIMVGINHSSSEELEKFNLPKAKGYITLSIADNGVGIPRENKERIFEPFFSTKAKGTGLGLATARRIIEAHKGIIIENGIPNNGALFKIFIPTCKEVEDYE